MSTFAIGIIIVLILLLIFIGYMIYRMSAPTIVITAANNAFQIGLCGSCSGAVKPIGADVSGMIPSGSYTPDSLAKQLQLSMNLATKSVSGLDNEWTVSFNPTTKTFFIFSNTRRAWAIKATANSIYGVIGMTSFINQFWMFWNGQIANSTMIGKPLAI